MFVRWDPKKAESNRFKHGVSFEEAASVFFDPLSVTFPDEEHSQSEQRYITMGIAVNGQTLVVIHTESHDEMRLISARRATSKERRFYEEG